MDPVDEQPYFSLLEAELEGNGTVRVGVVNSSGYLATWLTPEEARALADRLLLRAEQADRYPDQSTRFTI